MKRIRISRPRALTLFALLGAMVLAGQATAATHSFSWEHWIGSGHDSKDWNASKRGNHVWVKETCHADAMGQSGGNFTVEIRRSRGFQPDVSLGIRSFYCSNADDSATYESDAGGDHHFRFPTVDRGFIGITGSGHVNYPSG